MLDSITVLSAIFTTASRIDKLHTKNSLLDRRCQSIDRTVGKSTVSMHEAGSYKQKHLNMPRVEWSSDVAFVTYDRAVHSHSIEDPLIPNRLPTVCRKVEPGRHQPASASTRCTLCPLLETNKSRAANQARHTWRRRMSASKKNDAKLFSQGPATLAVLPSHSYGTPKAPCHGRFPKADRPLASAYVRRWLEHSNSTARACRCKLGSAGVDLFVAQETTRWALWSAVVEKEIFRARGASNRAPYPNFGRSWKCPLSRTTSLLFPILPRQMHPLPVAPARRSVHTCCSRAAGKLDPGHILGAVRHLERYR